jgi:hypothetical protein
LDLTAHTSLSPIRHGFAPTFVNYKKGALDSQPQVINFTSCLSRVAGEIDCHYILIIEFLKLLLSVFMLSFIFVIVCDLCELKRIWLFISILSMEIQLSRMTPISSMNKTDRQHRHVAPLEHIILIPSQPFFALSP